MDSAVRARGASCHPPHVHLSHPGLRLCGFMFGDPHGSQRQAAAYGNPRFRMENSGLNHLDQDISARTGGQSCVLHRAEAELRLGFPLARTKGKRGWLQSLAAKGWQPRPAGAGPAAGQGMADSEEEQGHSHLTRRQGVAPFYTGATGGAELLWGHQALSGSGASNSGPSDRSLGSRQDPASLPPRFPRLRELHVQACTHASSKWPLWPPAGSWETQSSSPCPSGQTSQWTMPS